MAAEQELRLPPFFPVVPKACKAEAAAFFDCFTPESEFGPGKPADVGRQALAKCADKLAPYNACAEAHLSARQRELVSAPDVYREQAAAARGATPAAPAADTQQ